MALPNCPQCNSEYTYQDQDLLICPECAHEWNPNEVLVDEDALIIKDASGKLLQEGDKVTLAKDLKVKGSSQVLKIGTKATIKRLVDGDHDIDCKVDGAGDMMLKSQFVKKQSAQVFSTLVTNTCERFCALAKVPNVLVTVPFKLDVFDY